MSSEEHICPKSYRGCKRKDCDTKCEELYCSIECACYDGVFSVTKGWLPSGIPPEENEGICQQCGKAKEMSREITENGDPIFYDCHYCDPIN